MLVSSRPSLLQKHIDSPVVWSYEAQNSRPNLNSSPKSRLDANLFKVFVKIHIGDTVFKVVGFCQFIL